MISVMWRRWLRRSPRRVSPSSRSTRQARRQPSLEGLETRELLTTATPLFIVNQHGLAAPMGSPGPTGYTPSQIRQAYGFSQIAFTKNGSPVTANGQGRTIAIVDAYDDPTMATDLQTFDRQFGLTNPTVTSTYSYNPNAATPTFTKVNQSGGTAMPTGNTSWAVETSLDVEWAHAVAPGANILLVEANSASFSDLLTAVRWAASQPGVSAVSMSWGGGEFQGESSYDSYFTTPSGHPGVVFIAASGDSGAPPSYPAVSPNVLSVGGTSLNLTSTKAYSSESAWAGSGGGISAIESQPSYQKGVVTQSGTQRANPDVAYDSNPNTGFPIVDSYTYGTTAPWAQIGGTSAAAPQWAGLVAIADQGRALNVQSPLDGRSQLLPMIYQMPSSNFHDITTGTTTGTPNYSATTGYDLTTGRGSPIANLVVNSLVNGTSPPPAPPPSPPPSPPPGSVTQPSDPGFETPSVGSSYRVDPTGSPWTFAGSAGVAGNNGPVTSGNPPAPQGTQVAWQQNGGTISQSVRFAAGSYTVSFYAAQRGNYPSNSTIRVQIDGQTVGSITPTGTSYAAYSTGSFTVTAGSHTVRFVGVGVGGSTVLFDKVGIAAAPATATGPISTQATPGVGLGLVGQGGLSTSLGSLPSGSGLSHGPLGSDPSALLSGRSGSSSPLLGNGSLLQELEARLLTAFSSLESAVRNDLLFMESEISQFLQPGGLAQLLSQLQQGASGPLGRLPGRRLIDQIMSGQTI